MKMHMAHHFPGMLENIGDLFSCCVQERHHLLLTKYAGPRRKTASYERGVMENITVEQSIFAQWLRAVPSLFLSPAQGDEVNAPRPRGCFGLAAVSAQGVTASNTDAV